MRYLAIDLGDKRTGVALGDSHTRIASPLTLIDTPITSAGGEELLKAIARVVEAELGKGPGELILGLPLNMDGTEGPRAKLSRDFAARLSARTGRDVQLFDERRTSLAAEERLARTGLTHKQKKLRRDAIAAATILQAFLNTHHTPQQGSPEPEEPDDDRAFM